MMGGTILPGLNYRSPPRLRNDSPGFFKNATILKNWGKTKGEKGKREKKKEKKEKRGEKKEDASFISSCYFLGFIVQSRKGGKHLIEMPRSHRLAS